MRITICLSERVTADLVESAKAFDLPIERILVGPARIADMFETMARTGGLVAVRQDRPDGLSKVVPIELPTLEQFRRKPGVKAFDGPLTDLGGVHPKGTIMEINYPEDALREIATLLKAATPLEAYSFGLWLYLGLLRTVRDYPGGALGVFSAGENRFYRCEG